MMKDFVKRLSAASWAVALVFGTTLAASADEPAVRVVQVAGTWLVAGAKISNNESLPPGAHVELQGGLRPDEQRKASLDVLYGDEGGRPLPWSCRGYETCAKGIDLPAASPFNAIFKPIAKALTLVRPSVLPEFDIRGVTQQDVRDGVVSRSGNRITLTGVFTGVDPGQYRVVLTRPDDSGSWQVVCDTQISLAHGAAAPTVAVNGATDGLYGVQLFDTAGSDELSEVALIVAAAPPGDAARQAAYANAIALTRTWPVDATTAAFVPTFLRRVLVGLADPGWSGAE